MHMDKIVPVGTLALDLEELEAMEAPVSEFDAGVMAGIAFGLGVLAGVAIAT